MSGLLDYVAEAIRLLRDQADAVHESHNAPGETTFEGEPEAEAAYAELERVANGLETEIAARLRGEAAQSEQQAVAWLLPSGELFTAEQLEAQRRAYGDTFGLLAKPLYTHPQPAAVAGDAVWSDEAAHVFRTAADAVGAHWHSWPDRFRAGMKAALAQDRAAQGAAPSAPLDADARLIAAAPALLEACETFAEWLRREDEGLPAGIERGAPDGERRWREWWNENLRICALAQEQARAAIRQATEGEGNE